MVLLNVCEKKGNVIGMKWLLWRCKDMDWSFILSGHDWSLQALDMRDSVLQNGCFYVKSPSWNLVLHLQLTFKSEYFYTGKVSLCGLAVNLWNVVTKEETGLKHCVPRKEDIKWHINLPSQVWVKGFEFQVGK